MIYLIIAGVAAYSAVLVFLFMNQRKMIYHPDTAIGAPESYGLSGFEDCLIRKDDHVLQLWRHPPVTGMPLIVYFHGNASHMGNRAGIYAALVQQGFGVLALSYRGYGKSTGTPDEAGLYADARVAMAYAAQEMGVTLAKTIVFGESLGTGVAVQMASEYAVAGLVLQAAYISVAQRAAEIYPFIPVKWLIKDRFHSLQKIAEVKAPLLLFHGVLDNTIPLAHGKKLFETATSPKRSYYFPEKSQ